MVGRILMFMWSLGALLVIGHAENVGSLSCLPFQCKETLQPGGAAGTSAHEPGLRHII